MSLYKLDCKQYSIKKKMLKSLLEEEKHHKKEIVKEEAKLKKQQAQIKKYNTLAEYKWLRENKKLYEEQLQVEKSIESLISYYKYRLEKLPDEIKQEKAEVEKLKKSILTKNPKYNFNAPEKPEKRNYKKELELSMGHLLSYEEIQDKNIKELETLRTKLSKVQSLSKKSKADQEKEQKIIIDISCVQTAIERMKNRILGRELSIADTVKAEYISKMKKKTLK